MMVKWQPTMQDLVREMRADLPSLFKDHPDGIPFSYLSSWYGESVQRIKSACVVLEERDKVKIHRAANKTQYILPPNALSRELLSDLTPRQRQLVNFVAGELETSKKDLLYTNYAQLSRLLRSSYGGMQLRVLRCVELDYLKVVSPSKAGKQYELVLALGAKYPKKTS